MTEQAFLRPADVCQYLSIGRTKLHTLEKSDPDFPPKTRISIRCVGWRKDQIDGWLQKKSDKEGVSSCVRSGKGTTNKDLSGHRFGALTAIRDSGERYSNGSSLWECECDCGGKCKANTASLLSGKKRSCGCLQGAHWKSIDELGAVEDY